MQKLAIDSSTELGRILVNAVQPADLPPHRRAYQLFRVEAPEITPGKTRSISHLCTTDVCFAALQTLSEGGESRMHSHAAMDGFWMVLKGRAVFLSPGGEAFRLGPMEGIMIPRGVPYSFHQEGEEQLNILQIEMLHARARRNTYTSYGEACSEEHIARAQAQVDFYDARHRTVPVDGPAAS
ncbi:MAG: cupin domain-containing protein [Betaproteobacteria bacterium]|nr:cupin domain-containing protein [Betaproteobacteria bacterium]